MNCFRCQSTAGMPVNCQFCDFHICKECFQIYINEFPYFSYYDILVYASKVHMIEEHKPVDLFDY